MTEKDYARLSAVSDSESLCLAHLGIRPFWLHYTPVDMHAWPSQRTRSLHSTRVYANGCSPGSGSVTCDG